MALANLYLEDLFRIYMGSSPPDYLDKTPPPHTPPRRAWSLYEFGTLEEILRVIVDKLAVKRRQEAVDVLGYYIQFINDGRRVGANEQRRRTLRVNVRQPRVFVTNEGVVQTAMSALLESFRAFERELFNRIGGEARVDNQMGESSAAQMRYSWPLGFFIDDIGVIITRSLEAYQPGPSEPEVRVEVDFKAHRQVLDAPQALGNRAEANRVAAEKALSAWNALQPRWRAALVRPNNDTKLRLHTEYSEMHRRRGLPPAPQW